MTRAVRWSSRNEGFIRKDLTEDEESKVETVIQATLLGNLIIKKAQKWKDVGSREFQQLFLIWMNKYICMLMVSIQ